MDKAVGGRARRRYDRGVSSFIEYLIFCGEKPFALLLENKAYLEVTQVRYLDSLLSTMFELAFMSDPKDVDSSTRISSRWESSELLCGLTDRHPECRKGLPRAVRCLVAWAREDGAPQRAPPLSIRFAFVIVAWALQRGFASFALGILFMYFALLRPAEFFSLRLPYL